MKKQCRRCEKLLPEEAFRRGHICRECEREKSRANTFLYIRGITYEERDEILKSQGGVCAVCGTDEAGSKKGWHIDHCHTTGTIRGVLCATCNIALGQVKDSPWRLIRLAEYALRHQVEGATTIPEGSRAKRLEAHSPS